MNRSKKKLFSLLYGQSVHIAPNTKVVPASDFSQVADAQEVLLAVQKDAARYREEVIAESETVKSVAAKEGYEEGFTQWTEHIAKLEQHIRDVAKSYERILVSVATKAAKKILGVELQREDAIVDIVSNTLKSVAQHKKIIIYVNRKSVDSLEQNRPRLKALFEDLQTLSIREREDISDGDCIIETEGGIINAQLEHQWQILEHAFSSMLRSDAAALAPKSHGE